MTKNILIKPHTIVMMVGPACCGKTTFAKNVILKQLEGKLTTKYLSSDDLRQHLAENTYPNKNAPQLLETSKFAFEILMKQLDAYTSYPINTEVVVVDTKGLAKEFRQQILDIANKNNYNVDVVLFNYKNTRDYYGGALDKKQVESGVRRLRTKVLREITTRKYNQIITVHDKSFVEFPEGFAVTVDDLEGYLSHLLPPQFEYIYVGDIHESLDEFKALLIKSKFIFEDDKIIGNEFGENKRIVLVGDWIDKGHNTKAMIEFLEKNVDYIYFVIGNHEDYAYRVLTGKVPPEKVTEKKRKYFTSISVLEKDEDLKERFFRLFEKAKSFYKYSNPEYPTVYVTHAPCEKKYIGKVDKESKRKQLNISIDYDLEGTDGFEQSLENQLDFLVKESELNEPYHFFGHIATLDDYRLGSAVGIDTGCVFGNRLTSVSVGKKNGKLYFHSVGSNKPVTMDLPRIFEKKLRSVNLADLDKKERGRMLYSAYNKINYVAGTMSPADKNEDTYELESLEKGIEYFKDRGVKQLILQPKFMGSRCELYLSNNLDNCFAVSRNGYRIRENIETLLENEYNKYSSYMKENKLKSFTIDGELMPWGTLGRGLIEESFKPYGKLVRDELNELEELGFEKEFNKTQHRKDESIFDSIKSKVTKKELADTFGLRDYQTFKALDVSYSVPIKDAKAMLDVFDEQVQIFGVEQEPYFEPFNILKQEDMDGKIVPMTWNNEEKFKFLSDKNYVVIDISDDNYIDALEKATDFFNLITKTKHMEGIVIKPLVDKKGVVPYMKVRNPRYLTLVYGYDYLLPKKYERLIAQKSIFRKLKKSLREHELAQKMLKIPTDEISPDNKDYINIAASILLEVREETTLDPRL